MYEAKGSDHKWRCGNGHVFTYPGKPTACPIVDCQSRLIEDVSQPPPPSTNAGPPDTSHLNHLFAIAWTIGFLAPVTGYFFVSDPYPTNDLRRATTFTLGFWDVALLLWTVKVGFWWQAVNSAYSVQQPSAPRALSPTLAASLLLLPVVQVFWVFPAIVGLAHRVNSLATTPDKRTRAPMGLAIALGVMASALWFHLFLSGGWRGEWSEPLSLYSTLPFRWDLLRSIVMAARPLEILQHLPGPLLSLVTYIAAWSLLLFFTSDMDRAVQALSNKPHDEE